MIGTIIIAVLVLVFLIIFFTLVPVAYGLAPFPHKFVLDLGHLLGCAYAVLLLPALSSH